ncbi:MAG: hypothetical protein IT210_19120 [Armatimonadetes bacterium]|nr:hypothetical protein [Armatimonadota bacterium]
MEYQDHGVGLRIHTDDLALGGGEPEAGLGLFFGTYRWQPARNEDPGFVGVLTIKGGSSLIPDIAEDIVLTLLSNDPDLVSQGVLFSAEMLASGESIEDVTAYLQSLGLFIYVNGEELQGGNVHLQ